MELRTTPMQRNSNASCHFTDNDRWARHLLLDPAWFGTGHPFTAWARLFKGIVRARVRARRAPRGTDAHRSGLARSWRVVAAGGRPVLVGGSRRARRSTG